MSEQDGNLQEQESTQEAQVPVTQEGAPGGEGTVETQPAQSAAETTTSAEPTAETQETTPPEDAPKYKIGERVWGKVVRLTESQAILGLGENELDEGTLDLVHMRDEFGNLSLSDGDGLQVYVVRVKPEIKLAPSLYPPAAEVMKKLKEAHEQKETIRARVTGVNRGGLDVMFEGRRAFCPFSQIEIGRCENPEIYINKILDFKVTELDEEKKRIVFSHRVILEEERKEKLSELRAQLSEGMECEGVVKRLQPFGAFVDIGGVDGLVHVSEIAYERLDHPSQVLKKGEKVRVKVLEITSGKDGKDRIRLSIKALMPDPWTIMEQSMHEGDIVTGKVMRVTEFGAFVKLLPGIEGLLHVSQYKPRSQEAPPEPPADGTPVVSDVPIVSQEITVKVTRIDTPRRRLSLSLRDEERPGGGGKFDHDASVGDRVEGVVRTVKPYGVFLDLPTLGPWVSGLLPGQETGLGREANLGKAFPPGMKLEVEIIDIDDRGRLRLSRRAFIEGAGDSMMPTGSGKGSALPTAPPGGFNVLAEALRRAQGKEEGKE